MQYCRLAKEGMEIFRATKFFPYTVSSIAVMDKCIGFMIRSSYRSPNSVVRQTRVPVVAGLWVLLALTLVMVIWGMLVPIESAAVARGNVVLLSSKKVIQHLEGGIIKEIFVKEGDHVKAGQELMRLSDTAATAARDIVLQQINAARAANSRLIAERDKLPEVVFDKDIIELGKTNPEVAKIITTQTNLFASEIEMQKAKLAILDQRIAQSHEEIGGLESQIDGTSGQLNLYDEEMDMVQKMYDKGYDTKPHLLEVHRHHDELRGNRGQYEAQVAKVEQNIAETKISIIDQQNEFQTKVGQELKDVQAQITDLETKLRAAKDVVDRTKITAPVGGIVMGLKYHTSGGVVSPGTPIMDIVPQDDQLIIEVHVKPTDIANVHAGLDARVIFSAYKMRNTPKVPGKVTQVSADVFTEERSMNPSSYYVARVEVDKNFLAHMQKHIELYPGMPADVMIKTGSRSFIGYLFKPITDSMHSAFREE
jgi:HlyD family secretion protein/epimerase transport system membrane fusion protein